MEERSLLQDLGRGLSCKCLKCGEGKLFKTWLKPVDTCDVCGEEFHHHRADDFPAYIVILLLGHMIVPLALEIEKSFSPPMWVHMATLLPLTFILCLVLLQPVKGAVIAVQWRMGMHGFKASKEKRIAN